MMQGSRASRWKALRSRLRGALRIATIPNVSAGPWQPSPAGFLSSARAARVMLAVSMLVTLCVFTSAVLALMHQSSHFIGDDLIALYQAHSMPLLEFLVEPMGEHFVPLDRLTTYLTDALAPGSFGAALLVLCPFHVLGMFYVYRTLLLLEPHVLEPSSRGAERLRLLHEPASWLLFGLFYVSVFVGSLFLWWTAGMNRVPFIAFASMAIYYYLRFRASGKRRHALASAAAFVLSLGYYTKGVLVPWYLLGLELCLWVDTSRAERRRNLMFACALALGTVVFASLWSVGQPASVQVLNTDLTFQLAYLSVTWKVLASGIVGDVYRAKAELTAPAIAASAAIVAAAAYSIRLRPRTAVTWLVLVGSLLVNVLMVSLSKNRTGGFGLAIPLVSDRYYWELVFVLVLFSAVVVAQLGPSRFGRWLRQGQARGWLLAAAVSGVTGVVAVRSFASLKADTPRTFAHYRRARTFVHHVQRDSRAILKSHETLLIVEGMVPQYIVMHPVEACRHSAVLRALGVPVAVSEAGPGVYRLLPSGRIVPSLD